MIFTPIIFDKDNIPPSFKAVNTTVVDAIFSAVARNVKAETGNNGINRSMAESETSLNNAQTAQQSISAATEFAISKEMTGMKTFEKSNSEIERVARMIVYEARNVEVLSSHVTRAVLRTEMEKMSPSETAEVAEAIRSSRIIHLVSTDTLIALRSVLEHKNNQNVV